MAPTTLLEQKTATSPRGRNAKTEGFPLKISEMLALLDGVYSVERTSVSNPKEIFNTKRAIKQAFLNQIERKGFSLVEVLSMCPTYWGKAPLEAAQWIETTMSGYFKLGKLK